MILYRHKPDHEEGVASGSPRPQLVTIPDRFRGALLGLAVGDALGTTLEFSGQGPHQLTDMVGGGPFDLRPGEWTDDTSMKLEVLGGS